MERRAENDPFRVSPSPDYLLKKESPARGEPANQGSRISRGHIFRESLTPNFKMRFGFFHV